MVGDRKMGVSPQIHALIASEGAPTNLIDYPILPSWIVLNVGRHWPNFSLKQVSRGQIDEDGCSSAA